MSPIVAGATFTSAATPTRAAGLKVKAPSAKRRDRNPNVNFDAYIRVSRTGGREGDGFYSLDIQADVIGRLARANDLEIGETVSGGRATADRELERLVRKVEEGASGGVIAWKLSRFSRSLADGAAGPGESAVLASDLLFTRVATSQ